MKKMQPADIMLQELNQKLASQTINKKDFKTEKMKIEEKLAPIQIELQKAENEFLQKLTKKYGDKGIKFKQNNNKIIMYSAEAIKKQVGKIYK